MDNVVDIQMDDALAIPSQIDKVESFTSPQPAMAPKQSDFFQQKSVDEWLVSSEAEQTEFRNDLVKELASSLTEMEKTLKTQTS